jgi:Flp pilus assembly protein TadB
MFLFLAAAVIALFAYSSIVAWISTPARERQARDRLTLLKTLAENPGEHAKQVLEYLREEEETRTESNAAAERKGWIVGGLMVIAVGVGLGVMLAVIADHGIWSVALIPLLIGCVLLGTGLLTDRRTGQPRDGVK